MNIIDLKIGMKGFFQAWSYNPRTKKRTALTDWIPNSMLENGMNQMADFSNWAGLGSKNQVGTVSVPAPNTNDTQLLGYIAGTANIVEHTSGAQATAPFYGWDRTTYQYPAGPPIANENLQEAGIGWEVNNSPPALITRALFTDELGGFPVFTPLADEVLQVTYELRYYPPLVDVERTIILDGITYDTITRASAVTSWGQDIGQIMGQKSLFNSDWQAYDGNVGTIEQAPSGLSAPCDNDDQFNLGYQNNSFYIDMQCDCGTAGWNLTNGIRSIRLRTNAGDFQTQFNAQGTGFTIPKDSSFTMQLVWRLSWAEFIIP